MSAVVFDIIFLDKLGALASASIYTALLLVILLCSQQKVGQAFRTLTAAGAAQQRSRRSRVLTVALALLAMAALFAFDQMLVNLLGHGRG